MPVFLVVKQFGFINKGVTNEKFGIFETAIIFFSAGHSLSLITRFRHTGDNSTEFVPGRAHFATGNTVRYMHGS